MVVPTIPGRWAHTSLTCVTIMIVIIDYGLGNLASIGNMLKRSARLSIKLAAGDVMRKALGVTS